MRLLTHQEFVKNSTRLRSIIVPLLARAMALRERK
jgi:hypothetical protein